MIRRCNPRFVRKTYAKTLSWRKAALALNALYNVAISHTTWMNYATRRQDIANLAIRAALGLDPRPCPACGHKPGMQLSLLLKRLAVRDLKRWQQLREGGQYKAASRFLEEVYNRKIKRR